MPADGAYTDQPWNDGPEKSLPSKKEEPCAENRRATSGSGIRNIKAIGDDWDEVCPSSPEEKGDRYCEIGPEKVWISKNPDRCREIQFPHHLDQGRYRSGNRIEP